MLWSALLRVDYEYFVSFILIQAFWSFDEVFSTYLKQIDKLIC